LGLFSLHGLSGTTVPTDVPVVFAVGLVRF
jgi:hypothetical protein